MKLNLKSSWRCNKISTGLTQQTETYVPRCIRAHYWYNKIYSSSQLGCSDRRANIIWRGTVIATWHYKIHYRKLFLSKRLHKSVRITKGYRVDGQGTENRSPTEARNVLFSTVSAPTLEHTRTASYPLVIESSVSRVKQRGQEAIDLLLEPRLKI
jgi:hypothetical protein